MSGPYWLPHTDKISLIDNFETDAVAGTARATCHYFPGTFPGHFPGNEIAPGLFFVGEAAAQAFGLLVRLSAAQELAQKAFWPTNIQLLLSEGSQVKPFAMIRPDQPITAYVYWDKGATDAKSVVGKVVLLKDNRLAGSAVIKGLPVSVNPESPEQVQVIILDR